MFPNEQDLLVAKSEMPHPGALLRKRLEKLSMTQAELAEKIGCAPPRINDVVQGKRGITAAFAIDLSEALGGDPKYWLDAQSAFDLAEERKKREDI